MKLTIVREHGYMGILRRLPVAVNGQLFWLRPGHQAEVEVHATKIEISSTMDWLEPSCWVLSGPPSVKSAEIRLKPHGLFDSLSPAQSQLEAKVVGSSDFELRQVDFSELASPVDFSADDRVRGPLLVSLVVVFLTAWVAGLARAAVSDNPTGWWLVVPLIGMGGAVLSGGRLYSQRVSAARVRRRSR
ncbi:hypothetical protein [Demetria terragena]|uniref:hypothetical protein n=1 Tax=Demetria terragena TaxID=63959 RepID=UPI0012EA49E2|nr:hypothetical protein [Demetria terragena]